MAASKETLDRRKFILRTSQVLAGTALAGGAVTRIRMASILSSIVRQKTYAAPANTGVGGVEYPSMVSLSSLIA